MFTRDKNNENWRVTIPDSIKDKLIDITHEKLGHSGAYKTLSYLKNYYYWRSLSRDVKRQVLTCDMCQRMKHLSIAMEGEYQWVETEGPHDLVTVDFYGPLPRGRGGVEFIFVFQVGAIVSYEKGYNTQDIKKNIRKLHTGVW